MVTIHADEKWLVKDLGLFIEPVEVCDAQGKLLGLFVPANLERGEQMYAEALANLDWTEIQRRRRDARPGEPLERTMQHLKEVDQEVKRRQASGEPAMTQAEAMAYYRALRDQARAVIGALQPAGTAGERGACASP